MTGRFFCAFFNIFYICIQKEKENWISCGGESFAKKRIK